jgi:outer membrane receptor protein involved in Fe transport
MKKLIFIIPFITLSFLFAEERASEVFFSISKKTNSNYSYLFENNTELLGVDENTNKVSEKLNQSPSVILRENTQNFGLSLISIRGFSSNQTAVLYDGIKLPKDITSTYDLSILPTLNIENIYLFKGGWSSVFGANSEGGVVALKSETLKDEKLVDLFSEFGPYSTHRYVFKTGVSKNGVSLLLSGEDYKSDGFQQNSYANKQSFTGKLTIGKDDHKLTLNTFLVDIDRGLPSGTPVDIKSFNGEREKKANYLTDWQSDRNFFISLKDEFKTGEFSNEISYSKNNLLRDAYQWSSLTTINTYSDNILARTSFEGYNFGIEYDKTKLRSNSYGNHEMKNIGYFANKSFNISEKLKTSVYLRYDDSKEYDNFLSPKLISDYKISDNLSVSYSIARAFRAPNFADVYGAPAYWYDPNPNIKPEKSLSNEISISYSGNINAIVSAYYYDIDDKITILTDTITWHSKSVNIAKGYNKGVEASLGYSYKEFYINLGGSLMDIKGKNVGSGSYKKLAYSPDYKFSFGAGYKSDSFEFGLNTIRVGDQYSDIDKKGKLIPSYTVTDISASKSFGDLKLFAKINNVFNERYATTADIYNGYYPANPRNLFAGLSLKF